jgi:redox-sensitive bicupin YhaK (pirin superfamily)
MQTQRPIKMILQRQPTLEGAGVRLFRVFGHREVPKLDPFLMLDDFRSDTPADYLNEPVAWQGPLVMNSDAELETAFREYRQGNFIKDY